MIGRIDTLEVARRFLTAIEEQDIEIPTPPDTLDEHKGEVAHIFAGLATQYYRDQLAADAHRTALEFIPKHPWVSNDYGYAILERGGDIAEAARLIEQAYEQVPERSSITDSLGWLRYKQGRIEDEPARAGEVGGGMGAVSLLSRATQLDEGGTNPEVLEHLGDALWRLEQKRRTQSATRAHHAAIRTPPTPNAGPAPPPCRKPAVIAVSSETHRRATGRSVHRMHPATFTPHPPLAEQPADPKPPSPGFHPQQEPTPWPSTTSGAGQAPQGRVDKRRGRVWTRSARLMVAQIGGPDPDSTSLRYAMDEPATPHAAVTVERAIKGWATPATSRTPATRATPPAASPSSSMP
jgi:hypothetical protein